MVLGIAVLLDRSQMVLRTLQTLMGEIATSAVEYSSSIMSDDGVWHCWMSDAGVWHCLLSDGGTSEESEIEVVRVFVDLYFLFCIKLQTYKSTKSQKTLGRHSRTRLLEWIAFSLTHLRRECLSCRERHEATPEDHTRNPPTKGRLHSHPVILRGPCDSVQARARRAVGVDRCFATRAYGCKQGDGTIVGGEREIHRLISPS